MRHMVFNLAKVLGGSLIVYATFAYYFHLFGLVSFERQLEKKVQRYCQPNSGTCTFKANMLVIVYI